MAAWYPFEMFPWSKLLLGCSYPIVLPDAFYSYLTIEACYDITLFGMWAVFFMEGAVVKESASGIIDEFFSLLFICGVDLFIKRSFKF